MDQGTKRSYAGRLMDCISDYEDSDPFQENTRRTETLLYRNGDNASILDLDKYEKLRGALLEKEGWGEKFTKDYVDKALKRMLVRIQEEDNNRNAPVYFSELADEIDNYSQEQIVYVPLGNIQMQVDSLPIGNITLVNMTTERFEDLAKKVESIITQQDWTEEAKQQAVQNWLGDLKGNSCAEYRCVAEPDRAGERAEEECQRIFDLFRYTIHMMGQDHYRIAVGRRGEVSRFTRSTPVISSDAQRFVISSRTIGPLAPFVISEQTVERMERLGVFKVAEILKQKRDEESFGETLLRGIRWFSYAQTQVTREIEFLNLMTCLETFLATRGIAQVTIMVAEGVAFVLATELEERRQLKNKIIDLYDKRSNVSHGGYSAFPDSDLKDLKNITGDFLRAMIQKIDELKTRKDLYNWIENQKLK